MEFYSYLKECMKMVSLDPKIESKLKNQITYFTFSYTIFLMFKNKTQQIKLLNKNTQILPIQFEKQKELLFQFAWCLHIYIRGYDQGLVESAILMCGVLSFVFLNVEQVMVLYEKKRVKLDRREVLGLFGMIFKIPQTHFNKLESILQMVESRVSLITRNLSQTKPNHNLTLTKNLRSSMKNLEQAVAHLTQLYRKKLNPLRDLDQTQFITETQSLYQKKYQFTPLFDSDSPQTLDIKSFLITNTQKRLQIDAFQRAQGAQTASTATTMTSLSQFDMDLGTNGQIGTGLQFLSPQVEKCLDMYSWLQKKVEIAVKKKKRSSRLYQYSQIISFGHYQFLLENVHCIIQQSLINQTKQHPQMKKIIPQFYFGLLEEMILKEEKTQSSALIQEMLSNEQFHNSLIVCCIEIFNFIIQVKGGGMERLFEQVHIDGFDFWKILQNFRNSRGGGVICGQSVKSTQNSGLPRAILKFLEGLERKILRSLVWRSNSQISKMIETLAQRAQDRGNNSDHQPPLEHSISQQRFFAKVSEYGADLIYKFSTSLDLDEAICSEAYALIQHILTHKTQMLVGKNLDTIVICSIYVTMKLHKQQVSWNVFSMEYTHKDQSFDKQDYDEIFNSIELLNGMRVNIQDFYNRTFCGQIQSYLLRRRGSMGKVKNMDHQQEQRILPNEIMPSSDPISEGSTLSPILKIQTLKGSSQKVNWMRRNRHPVQTTTLFTFGDSPCNNFCRSYNQNLGLKRKSSYPQRNDQKKLIKMMPSFRTPLVQKILHAQEKIVKQQIIDDSSSKQFMKNSGNPFQQTAELGQKV